MKNSPEGLINRVTAAEDRTSDLQDAMQNTPHSPEKSRRWNKSLKINSRQENSEINSREAI